MDTIVCQTGESVDVWSTVEGNRKRVVLSIANGNVMSAHLTLTQAKAHALAVLEEIAVLEGRMPEPRAGKPRAVPAVASAA